MRVVIDTNVLISGFISSGAAPAKIVELLRTEAIELLISNDVYTELNRVIRYAKLRARYAYTDEQIERFLHGIKTSAVWVESSERLTVVVQDESDNRFLELAVSGSARYVITGDTKHLLPLQHYRGIEIVSPAIFMFLYEQSQT